MRVEAVCRSQLSSCPSSSSSASSASPRPS